MKKFGEWGLYEMKNEDMLIQGNITILVAMKCLDHTAKKVLFIVDGARRLQASVTDGDVRRWILAKGNLDAEVCLAANNHPIFLTEEKENRAFSLMKQRKIDAVPILDDGHRVIKIITAVGGEQEELSTELSGIPVVIMAGGKGTRLYPYTKILPKPLIPIGDVPIIEHIMNQFHRYGCNDFFLVVNHKKNMIKAYFAENDMGYHVTYADEEIPLGTGGGLSLLNGKIQTTFVLSNCDILIKEDFGKMYRQHKSQGNLITMVCAAKHFQIPYGVIEIDEKGGIKEMSEKPSLSFLTNTGCYFVEPEVVANLKEPVCLSFPDIIEKYREAEAKIGIYPVSENSWLDMGQMEELRRMEEQYGKGDAE